jgi:hypothetical protein
MQQTPQPLHTPAKICGRIRAAIGGRIRAAIRGRHLRDWVIYFRISGRRLGIGGRRLGV